MITARRAAVAAALMAVTAGETTTTTGTFTAPANFTAEYRIAVTNDCVSKTHLEKLHKAGDDPFGESVNISGTFNTTDTMTCVMAQSALYNETEGMDSDMMITTFAVFEKAGISMDEIADGTPDSFNINTDKMFDRSIRPSNFSGKTFLKGLKEQGVVTVSRLQASDFNFTENMEYTFYKRGPGSHGGSKSSGGMGGPGRGMGGPGPSPPAPTLPGTPPGSDPLGHGPSRSPPTSSQGGGGAAGAGAGYAAGAGALSLSIAGAAACATLVLLLA